MILHRFYDLRWPRAHAAACSRLVQSPQFFKSVRHDAYVRTRLYREREYLNIPTRRIINAVLIKRATRREATRKMSYDRSDYDAMWAIETLFPVTWTVTSGNPLWDLPFVYKFCVRVRAYIYIACVCERERGEGAFIARNELQNGTIL